MSRVIKSVDCPSETVPAGQVIFTEGSVSDCFYIIKSGEVEIFKHYGKPEQLLIATIPAGRVLGEVASLDGGPRSAAAVARTPSELVKVSSKTLKWQLDQCPNWFRAVILDVVERLRSTDDKLASARLDSSAVSGMTSMLDTQASEQSDGLE